MEENVEYQLASSVNEGILEIVITGKVTGNIIEKLENEIMAIIKAKKTDNLLVDARAIKEHFGFGKVYFLARNLSPDRPRVHVAIVDLAENADYRSFQETTSVNASLSWKWFTDMDAARAWLKSK